MFRQLSVSIFRLTQLNTAEFEKTDICYLIIIYLILQFMLYTSIDDLIEYKKEQAEPTCHVMQWR